MQKSDLRYLSQFSRKRYKSLTKVTFRGAFFFWTSCCSTDDADDEVDSVSESDESDAWKKRDDIFDSV